MNEMKVVRFFPDWGNRWSLWGGGPLDPRQLGLSEELIERLASWTRVWQVDLDPEIEVRWPTLDMGRSWIREGNDLVSEINKELAGSARVEASFAMFDPDATEG